MEVESYRPDLEVVAGEDLPNPARVAAGVAVAVHHPEEVEVVEAEFLLEAVAEVVEVEVRW